MSTLPVQQQPVNAPQGGDTQVTAVKYNGHTVIPAAHKKNFCEKNGCNVFGGILGVIMLIAGAVLWGLNAGLGGDPSMLLAGQVLTGLALGGIVIRIIAAGCKCIFSQKESGNTGDYTTVYTNPHDSN